MKSQNLFFKRHALFAFIFFTSSCYGVEEGHEKKGVFWEDGRKGWFFYKNTPEEDEKKPTEEEKGTVSSAAGSAPKTESYKEKLEKWQEAFAEAKAKAIFHPTPQNIGMVQTMHRQMTDLSAVFSKRWMEVGLQKGLLTYPEANGTPLFLEVQKKQHLQKVKNSFEKAKQKNFGMFLITKGGCAYCEKFAPVVKRFAKEYGFDVLEIYDGAPTGAFSSQPDNGLISQLNPERMFPMLFLVDTQNKHFHPIARGMAMPSELFENAAMVLEILEREGVLS